jgi:hypothetical protein
LVNKGLVLPGQNRRKTASRAQKNAAEFPFALMHPVVF